MATVHDLKCWPDPFAAIARGDKTAEFRRDDRGFGVGDWLTIREWNQHSQEFTGRIIAPLLITDIRRGGQFGIPEGFAMLSFKRLP